MSFRGIEAGFFSTRVNVESHENSPIVLNHPTVSHLRDAIGTLKALQVKTSRFAALEEDIANQIRTLVSDGVLLNLHYPVPNDPENPNRIVHLGSFRLNDVALDPESREWKALVIRDGENTSPDLPIPIANLSIER